ncbi:hypothetical protein [Novosphingobium sp.]|uniref:hypothetical protein n=1 Tax=Novosphingobium sp. TaxID=1874826 RepID=UPI002B47AC54|nr:hypothetical protein [Novosphingobium sp.]HKR92613.1 hypothetical protein [Novosphingobium sp.]
MKDFIWLVKFVAMPCGLAISVRFFQPWPIVSLTLGAVFAAIGPPETTRREHYIAPAQRPKPTTVSRQRITIMSLFGLCLSACLLMLWIGDFLSAKYFFRAMGWYLIGVIVVWSSMAFVKAPSNTEKYNKWLSDMAPWEGG